ncbi:methyltransferase domain-containing protein [Anabaena sp. PCC 7108]|uniref:methyltransferase domain-containing protein n=1 Tax=Anabaena sp. PCC 7108 TaxID=163908 RepID=UPI0003452EC9|nr:methyltransferase domain-containing protein [Anabaena sp. PCC 7108]
MILPNYLWWQQQGYDWIKEIDNRKKFQLIYHLQELVLIDYFQNLRCRQILEFGCGFGRHLKYLREIPDLKVFGYDQSESMLASMANWAEPEWVNEYIKIGNQGDALPYPDNYFDVVFTTSVLIHIAPQDIKAVIKELVRVAKNQVIHLEPAPDYEVVLSAHNGSWNHNLVEIYESIGCQCEILNPAFKIQRLYKVLVNSNQIDSRYTPSNLFLNKLFDLENNIQITLDNLLQERDDLAQRHQILSQERDDLAQRHQILSQERDDLAQRHQILSQERDDLAQRHQILSQERDDLAQQRDSFKITLNEILDSRTWNTIQVIKNNSYLKSLGHTTLNIIQALSINIKSKLKAVESNFINKSDIAIYDEEMELWLQSIKQENQKILAVYVPTWLGINSATQNMFENCYALPEFLSKEQADYYAKIILSNGIKHLIIAGVSPGHLELVNSVKELNPDIRCDITWHGSYLQNCEDYAWSMMNQSVQLGKRGIIYKFGFAKKGMEKTFHSMGLRSEFLPNFVNRIPESANAINSENPQLGIWLSGISYRKLPYAMIASVHLVSNAVLNIAGAGDRAKEWADTLGVEFNYYNPNPIPREELHQRIKNTHLSLYLTSSECAPMLPIESLSLGVPCLIAPVSHWFEDDEYLHSRLVVPYPERPEIIAQYIQQALLEREEIIERYKIYIIRYNHWATQQVKRFIGD